MSIKIGDNEGATNGVAASSIGSKKIVIFAVLLVLMTFPQSTQEFAFKFGGIGVGGGSDENGNKQIDGANKRAPLVKRERKFKFHKIERIYEDADENENTNGDDDDDDNNENINSNGNDNDNDNENSKQAVATNAANDDEEQEYQFKHARKAEKQRKTVTRKEDSDSSFFGSIFGSSEKKKKKERGASNGIIDWIMWLGERTGRIREEVPPPPPPPAAEEEENWLSYLDRWPFNALFPIGITKTITMPRKAGADRKKYGKSSNAEDEEPMSEAHFNYLLHTLPAFVINYTHVSRDLECRQHMQVFQRQLRGKKLWTLQMLDATGKITSGILRGNINRFGDFDLCTQVKATVKVTTDHQMRMRGKYCLAHIEADTDVPELKPAVHLAHGRGLFNSHLGNPSHFLSRYSVANWGVCIPHICPASVVQEMLEENLRPYNRSGIEFHVEVDDNDCTIRPSKNLMKLMKKDRKFFLAVLYILAHIAFVSAALIYDYRAMLKDFFQQFLKSKETEVKKEEDAEEKSATENEESTETETKDDKAEETNENLNETTAEDEQVVEEQTDSPGFKQLLAQIFLLYSPKSTLQNLLNQDANDVEFPIFHILKIGATLMLYVCLKFIMIGHLPISNRDKLVQFVEKPYSVLFRVPLIYADILLLLGGFMVAYQLSEEMAEKRFINLLKRLAAKVTRYLPTVFMVLTFQTWILPQLGTGPLWSNLVGQHAQICEAQMWRNAFNLQNAIDFEDTCSPLTVQLALQVQLFLLGPLIVWLYYTDADAGFFVYGALHALSVAARFSRTNREHLSMTLFHGINVSKFYRSANLLYSSPISRATPYLLGIGFGILYRKQQGTLELLKELVIFGWSLCCMGIVWCFWSASAGMSTDFMYNASEAASYAAWSPLILGLAVCWIIFMFPRNENSMLKFLSSTRPILVLSRIAFPIQLVTYVVVLHNTAKVRETIKFHFTYLFDFNEIGAILFYAVLLAFILDVPVQHVRHIIIERLFIERAAVEEPESGVEQSEAETSEQEASEQQNEKVTSDTPEPADTIWASDPEEEEKQYLARRRSSTVPLESSSIEKNSEKVEPTVAEDEEEEEEEEEEETEITEEAEIKRSPTPEKIMPRRRRPTTGDD